MGVASGGRTLDSCARHRFLPRFAPSPTALGEALAERILEGFRKDLESVDLRAKTHKRHAARQK